MGSAFKKSRDIDFEILSIRGTAFMGGRFRGLAVRSISSAVVGAAVAVVAFLGAYRNLQGWLGLRYDESEARWRLDDLERKIEEHRKSDGRLPTSLAEVVRVEEARFGADVEGRPLDPWGRPFQYRAMGDRFDLHSFGRDGRPGGEGSDADVYPRSANRPFPPPTIRQFYFDFPTEGIRRTCQVAGVIAALACFTAPRRHAPEAGRGMVAGVVATSIGAILVAIFLSALHVPNGH